MDELRLLGSMLAEPGPAQDVVEGGRRRLSRAMRGRARRRQAGPAAGLALTATAAAAAAVVVVAVVTTSANTPNSPPPTAAPSGRQVLLAAAATAAAKPARTGTFWQVESVVVSADGRIRLTSGTWTRRDGQTWISVEPGKISKLPRRQPIMVRGTDIDFEGIQRLPADPAELTATLRRHLTGPRSSGGGFRDIALLQGLLNEVPAPPKVRAAAFRALAALPQIKNLGKTRSGYVLVFGADGAGSRLVVDPNATMVRAEGFTAFGGGTQSMGADTRTGRWTDRLPPYQVVPIERQKNYGISCRDGNNKPVCTLTAR